MTSQPDPDGGVRSEVEDEGGEPACYAHLVCPECGAVTTEGHLPDCRLAAADVSD